jgi:DNA polymerase V
MGVPYFQIKDTLQKAGTAVFSSHFALYRDVSRRVFSVMREEIDMVQQYSVDEAFFALNEFPEATAWRVKHAVEKRVGIPVSLGIAHTKTQAKYANSVAKKTTGVHVLSAKEWNQSVVGILLSSIWGVGGRLELQYKKHGLTTVGQFLACDRERIARLFGVVGVRLYDELSGRMVLSLENTQEPQKSLMNSRSFKNETTEYAVVADAVAYHVRHAMADLRAMQMKTSSIRVSIRPSRHGDFMLRGGSKEAVLPTPTDDTFVALRIAEQLTEELFEPGVSYKKAGVVLNQFTPAESGQIALFHTETAVQNKTQPLMSILDAINLKSDREALVLGSRLRTKAWQARVDARSPAYTTRWSDIAEAKA